LEFFIKNWGCQRDQKLEKIIAILKFVWLNAGGVRDVPEYEMYPTLHTSAASPSDPPFELKLGLSYK